MKNKIINKNLHTNNVITCDNITIGFGKKKNFRPVIQNFSFAFEKNKIYAIVGNSGVGKTSLVTHFNGLKIAHDGYIFIKDKVIYPRQRKLKNYKAIRKDVSLVFQFPEYQLFKDTVLKDIAYGPINYNVDKQEAHKIASKYSYLVGIDKELWNHNPFTLSNGQKRLVAIAGILAIDSEVVILDEPTAGLDPYYQNKITNIIKKLKSQGKTIIIITHNMDNVLALADEVLVLHNHKLIKSGSSYQIFNNKNLLHKAGLATPYVILTLNYLIKKSKKYKKLIKYQPKTLDELIKLIKKGGN